MGSGVAYTKHLATLSIGSLQRRAQRRAFSSQPIPDCNIRKSDPLTAASTIDYIRTMPIIRAACALLIASSTICIAPRCFANEVDPYAEALAPAPAATSATSASSASSASSGNIFRKWFGANKAVEGDSPAIEREAPVADRSAAAPDPAQRASDLVVGALGLLGIGYRRGGNTPQSGFDCSGMVRYVFQNTLGLDLPRRAEEISRVGTKVGRNDLKPGDLVFYNTLRKTFSHVGIYLGNNRFIHAPATGGVVRVEDMSQSYWARRFTGARRVAD